LQRGRAHPDRLADWTGWIALAGMAFFIVYDPLTKARARRSRSSEGASQEKLC